MFIDKLKGHNSPGTDQFPAEHIRRGCSTIRDEIDKITNSLFNNEDLPEKLKESIIVLIYRKSYKTDCSSYRGISLLSTTYKISNILLTRLTPYAEEIIWDHQCEFRRKGSTTDIPFCIRQILENK